MPKQRKQDNDRDWNANQPEKYAAAHFSLHSSLLGFGAMFVAAKPTRHCVVCHAILVNLIVANNASGASLGIYLRENMPMRTRRSIKCYLDAVFWRRNRIDRVLGNFRSYRI